MSFDPQSFLDMSVTEASSTQSTPIPPGDYMAVIDKVDCRQWQGKKDPSKSGLTLDVTWSIDDPSLKELLGRDKISCKQGIMLDLTEAGGLDMGKGRNITLGRLREAVNLNTPGVAFAFSMLPGRVARVNIKHRVDGDNIYAEVGGVAKP